MKLVTKDELKERLTMERPNNNDRTKGFALVNVLDHQTFVDEHIPGSINIPKGQESDFERRFDKAKEIIVYCGSAQCPASSDVADKLEDQGFTNVLKYEGGMDEWKEARNQLERGEVSGREMHAS